MLSIQRRQLLRAAGAGAVLSAFAKRWVKPAFAASQPKFVMVWHANGAPTVGERAWAERVPGASLSFTRYGGNGDHNSGIPYSTTGFSKKPEQRADGPSIDHVIAKAHGTPVMVVTGKAKSQNYRGWCSYDDGGSPILPIESPRAAFTSVFGTDPGGGGSIDLPSQPTPTAGYSAELEAAILDRAIADIQDLRQQLPTGLQRSKMDDQFEALQMLSEQIAPATGGGGGTLPAVNADCADVDALKSNFAEPDGGFSFQERSALHIELIVTALACGARTSATWMMTPGGHDSMEFSFIGVPGSDPHNTIAHGAGSSNYAEMMRTIKNWEMDQVAHLMKRLGEVPDADGATLLGNTAVLITSEVAWGPHQPIDQVPVMVAGTAKNAQAGKYTQTLVNVAEAAGVSLGSFGDGN